MIEAIFLNPLTKAQLKSGRKGSARTHTIRSKTLKSWQSVVKKHGGDMKAAAREWKSRSRSVGSSRRGAGSRRKRISVKGLSGLAARRAASNSTRGAKGGVPMAARKRSRRRRRRNQLPPTAAWIAKWRAGMERAGRKPKRGPRFKKISAVAVTGQKQWKGRYKRKIRGAMRKHVRVHKGRGARSFARRVTRGVARSTIVNPVGYEMWHRRFMQSTGFAPYKKRTKTGRRSRRRRGPKPGTRAWGRAVVRGVKRRPASYGRGVSKAGLPEKWRKGIIGAMKEAFPRLKANPRRGTKRRRSMRRRRYPIVRAAQMRGLMLNLRPRKRSRRKSRRRYSRRRRMLNPVMDSLKSMVTQPSLMTYAYVSGGFAAGAILPKLLAKYILKGEKSAMVEAAIGIASSAAAGLGVAMATKNDQNGVLVAAGGLAGVVGNFIVGQLNKALGFSGLGQAAEDALKAAVEQEMARAGLTGGVGQFLMPSQAEELGTSGMGQFLTEPELQMDVAQTEGLGQSMDLEATGSAAFAGSFDGSVF